MKLTVYKRQLKGGAVWYARWTDENGRRCRRSVGQADVVSYADAKRRASELVKRDMVDRELGINWTNIKLGDAAARFLAAKELDMADRSIVEVRRAVELVTTVLGPGMPLRSVRPDDANRVLEKVSHHRLATVRNYARWGKHFFRWCVDQELIGHSPWSKVRSAQPDPDKEWAYIPIPSLARLIHHSPSDGWRCFWILCRMCGLRQGEALRVEWTDVDLREGLVHVANPRGIRTTKARRRLVPLFDLPRRILTAYEARRDSDKLCGMSRSNLYLDAHRIREKAGLPTWEKWCHTLRKNFATDIAHVHGAHAAADWLGDSIDVAHRHYMQASIPEGGADWCKFQHQSAHHGLHPGRSIIIKPLRTTTCGRSSIGRVSAFQAEK